MEEAGLNIAYPTVLPSRIGVTISTTVVNNYCIHRFMVIGLNEIGLSPRGLPGPKTMSGKG
jgi:hypothetical protein